MNVPDPRPPETEDDGFVTMDMTAVLRRADAATAEAAGGQTQLPAPKTRTERLMASMAADKDKAEAELASIEAQIIQAEEIHVAGQRQVAAEYAETVRAAKEELDRMLARLGEDRDANMAALEASKADILGVVAMLSGGIEAGVEEGVGK